MLGETRSRRFAESSKRDVSSGFEHCSILSQEEKYLPFLSREVDGIQPTIVAFFIG